MSADTIPTVTDEGMALMVALYQLVDGEAICDYCDQEATLGIATGADPEVCPCCYLHAMGLVTVSTHMAGQLSGITSGGDGE